jgi:hypothetical protein
LKLRSIIDESLARRALMKVINQQFQGRVRIGEPRVRTSGLPLDRGRLLEHPRASEEREEDDRGRGGALYPLEPATAPRTSRSRRHRGLLFGSFGDGETYETGFRGLSRRSRERGRPDGTEVAQDTLELRDPDPFLEVRVRPTRGTAPRFFGSLREHDDLRGRRYPSDPFDEAGALVQSESLVHDQGLGAIIGCKRDEVGTHGHHREDLEASLGEEEAHQRALERSGHRDQDPERP